MNKNKINVFHRLLRILCVRLALDWVMIEIKAINEVLCTEQYQYRWLWWNCQKYVHCWPYMGGWSNMFCEPDVTSMFYSHINVKFQHNFFVESIIQANIISHIWFSHRVEIVGSNCTKNSKKTPKFILWQ